MYKQIWIELNLYSINTHSGQKCTATWTVSFKNYIFRAHQDKFLRTKYKEEDLSSFKTAETTEKFCLSEMSSLSVWTFQITLPAVTSCID